MYPCNGIFSLSNKVSISITLGVVSGLIIVIILTQDIIFPQ